VFRKRFPTCLLPLFSKLRCPTCKQVSPFIDAKRLIANFQAITLIDALPSISVISCANGGGGGGGGGGSRNGENLGDFGMESDSEEDVSGRTKVGSEEVVIMCDNECGGIEDERVSDRDTYY
jgi:hypothetical protein